MKRSSSASSLSPVAAPAAKVACAAPVAAVQLEQVIDAEASLILTHLCCTPDPGDEAEAYRASNAALFRLAATNHAIREHALAHFQRVVGARLDRAFADLQVAWAAIKHTKGDCFSHEKFTWPASVPRPTTHRARGDYDRGHPEPFTTVHVDPLFLRRWAIGRWPGGCNDAFARRFRSEHYFNACGDVVGERNGHKALVSLAWFPEERHPMCHFVALLGRNLIYVRDALLYLAHDQPIVETGPLVLLYGALAAVRAVGFHYLYLYLCDLVTDLLDQERAPDAPNPNFVPHYRATGQQQGCLPPDSDFVGAGRGDLV